MKEIKFDMAYIAQYSPRFGTPAAKLKDNITRPEKKQREKILNEILRKTALENNKKYINKIVEVLIENKKGNYYFGRTRTFKNVKVNPAPLLKQKWCWVKITKAGPWGLEAIFVNSVDKKN